MKYGNSLFKITFSVRSNSYYRFSSVFLSSYVVLWISTVVPYYPLKKLIFQKYTVYICWLILAWPYSYKNTMKCQHFNNDSNPTLFTSASKEILSKADIHELVPWMRNFTILKGFCRIALQTRETINRYFKWMFHKSTKPGNWPAP